jgi:putative ABC transport system substrate-binding protein
MRRREVLAMLGGVTVPQVWSPASRAQGREPMRHVGVLVGATADDAESQLRVAALADGLAQSGWHQGRNLRLDFRWASTDDDEIRRAAVEMVRSEPAVIVAATGSATVAPLLQATRSIPIVFANVIDPVGAGFVASLARPGGNATGFTVFEYGMSGKWLALAKEIAPQVTRAAVLLNPAIASGVGQLAAIQAAAPSLGVDVTPIDARNPAEIERAVADFAQSANGAMIVTSNGAATHHRELIVALAARHRLPAIYGGRWFVAAGGLLSYAPDFADQFRDTASYVDRILKGERPADMPIQAATRYLLIINLNTAKALGLDLSPTLLARADEVIE